MAGEDVFEGDIVRQGLGVHTSVGLAFVDESKAPKDWPEEAWVPLEYGDWSAGKGKAGPDAKDVTAACAGDDASARVSSPRGDTLADAVADAVAVADVAELGAHVLDGDASSMERAEATFTSSCER